MKTSHCLLPLLSLILPLASSLPSYTSCSIDNYVRTCTEYHANGGSDSWSETLTDELCKGKTAPFIHNGRVKNCTFNSQGASVKVIGCEFTQELFDSNDKGDAEISPIQLLFNHNHELYKDKEGLKVKCVKNGGTTKIITEDFELCEKQGNETILDARFYKRCNVHPKYGGNLEMIGCKSLFTESMLPLGKEKREEFDDAPGYEEKCTRDDNGHPTYTSNSLPSRKQRAINDLCEAQRDNGTTGFFYEGALKECYVNGTNYDIEVIGCEFTPEHSKRELKFCARPLEFGETAEIYYDKKGPTVICVRDGQESAKLISVDSHRCKNEEEQIIDGDYVKRCVYHPKYGGSLEIIGCKSAFNDLMLHLNEERQQVFEDAPGYEEKCLRSEDNVIYTSRTLPSRKQAAIDEYCSDPSRSEGQDFVEDKVVKRCTKNDESYTVEVEACLVQGNFILNNKKESFEEKIRVNSESTADIFGRRIQLKCMAKDDSAMIVSGDYDICENRTIGEEVMDGDKIWTCTLDEDGHFTAEERVRVDER